MKQQLDLILLGVLGTLTVVMLTITFPWSSLKRLGNQVWSVPRRMFRRVFGLEHLEMLLLDELREQSKRTSNLECERLGYQSNATLHRRADQNSKALQHSHDRVTSLRREVEEIGLLLRQYVDALGPMWTTAVGDSMPMRLLSSSHLRNIRNGSFTKSWEVEQFIDRELNRRSIDDTWRAREAEGRPAPTLEDLIKQGPGVLDPNASTIYTPEVEERVHSVLPIWAQNIIDQLRVGNNTVLTRANRRRMRGLPIWAQQLITNLEQA